MDRRRDRQTDIGKNKDRLERTKRSADSARLFFQSMLILKREKNRERGESVG